MKSGAKKHAKFGAIIIQLQTFIANISVTVTSQAIRKKSAEE